MKKSLGIIGFGRFGQLAAKYLKKYFRISVSDLVNKTKEARKTGVTFTSIKECATNDIILICVPISDFEKVLQQIVPFLKNKALVIDVCSVKEKTVKVMEKLIPERCECIGMHPLLGPDTTKSGLKGKKIVLCPIRTKKLTQIKSFLRELGLIPITATPEKHDKQMAKSLALIHLLGKALHRINVERIEMSTPTHEKLMKLVDITINESEQLFVDMQLYNRFARETRKNLIKALIKIDGELDEKNI